jgi:Acetamidase/Formamidase family
VAEQQITRDSTAADVRRLDFDRIYPLAGPIHVRGAQPGDALAIEILGFELPEWGWACIIPGLGLLPADEFPSPAIRVFDLSDGDWTELCPGVRIPIEPFCGTLGVPGAGMRGVPIPPPHSGGRNIDLRHLTAVTTLYLPVGVPGGLLSLGDAHAQGDGEVAISGIECDMTTRLRISVGKGRRHSGAAAATRSRLADPARRSRRLPRDHEGRAGPDAGQPAGGPGDDLPPRVRAGDLARGRLHPLLAGRRSEDHRAGRRAELDRRLLRARRCLRTPLERSNLAGRSPARSTPGDNETLDT